MKEEFLKLVHGLDPRERNPTIGIWCGATVDKQYLLVRIPSSFKAKVVAFDQAGAESLIWDMLKLYRRNWPDSPLPEIPTAPHIPDEQLAQYGR